MMKTLHDLTQLIDREYELNDGKVLKYQFSIDYHNKMIRIYKRIGNNSEQLGQNLPFETVAEIQLAYWMIWNTCRHSELDVPENLKTK